MKKPTIKDVAALAGVSYQTVSRVLNNKSEVRPETKQRILEAIDTLNYSPDPLARSLVGQNSFTIGVIIATYTGYTCNLILKGVDAYVRSKGYNLVILGTETQSSAEPDASILLGKQRLEGLMVIYHGSQDDPHRLLLNIPSSLPVVSTGYLVEKPDAKVIHLDTYDGAKAVTEHLVALGHTSIATILGPAKTSEVIRRLKGFTDVLTAHNLSMDQDLVAHGNWTMESGYKAMNQILSTSKSFSAIFVHNDQMAFGAIRALKEVGLRVPEDVSVAGFNNHPLSTFSIPAITTVSYPAEELGRYGAELLLSMLEPTIKPIKPPLEQHLYVRESTAFVSQKRNRA